DPAERRVPRRDANTESELVAALPPSPRHFSEALPHRERHAQRLQLVTFDRQRIVEEDHHPVAREVFERPLMLDDELAHGAVVLAEDSENLLRLGGFGVGRDVPEAAGPRRDRAALA